MKKIYLFLTTILLAASAAAKDINITNMTTSDYRGFMGVFGFSGDDGQYSLSLGLYAGEQVTGHYEYDQMAYCTLVLTGTDTYETIPITTAQADVAEAENGYRVTATLHDDQGETYNIRMALEVPDPIATVKLDFTQSAERMKNSNLIMYSATQGDLKFHLCFISAVGDGDYDINALSSYYTFLENTQDETSVSMLNARTSLRTEGDILHIDVDFLGTDTIQYLISMFYQIPQRRTEIVHITDMAQVRRYDNYDYQIIGTDGKHRVALDLITDQLEGQYTQEDFYPSGTFVIHLDRFGQETGTSYFEEGEAQITVRGDTTYISANLLCDDNIIYQVDMWYALPQVRQTVQEDIPDYQVDDYTYEYGTFQMQGISTRGDYVSIAVYSDDLMGQYTDAQLDGAYSIVIPAGTQSQIHILWARFSVAPDVQGKATLQGEFLGEDGVKYRVTMGIPDLSDVQEIPSGQTQGATYDLSGRRVSPTTRGLLIRNGKKILVR